MKEKISDLTLEEDAFKRVKKLKTIHEEAALELLRSVPKSDLPAIGDLVYAATILT